MSFEIGRILRFNGDNWGLLDYNKQAKEATVYSISKCEKETFIISPDHFEQLYSRSTDTSQKVVDFALSEVIRETEIREKLKPGVKFIGDDGKECTFLRFKEKNTIIYLRDNVFSNDFDYIKSVLDESNEDYLNYLNPVQTKKEYNSLSCKEKIMIAINICNDTYLIDEDDELEILEIGDIVSGEAFYYEEDIHYNLIGLKIKCKYKYSFMDEYSTNVGFFPIYIGNAKKHYPITFPQTDHSESDMFANGYGDEIYVDSILIKKESLADVVKL